MTARAQTLDRDRPRLTGRAAALLVTVTVLGVLALVPARAYVDQRSQIAELERRTQQLETQNSGLRAEISKLRDPAELEFLARECLGMVMAGEIAFVTDAPAAIPAGC